MKKHLLAMALLCLAFTSALPQTPTKIITRPKMPNRDALERMNLTVAWHTQVRTDGLRDGLVSVQVIPGDPGPQLVAQTYEGAVVLFDANTGDLLWKTKVGVPYWPSQPVGFNSQCIFATRRNVLHVINRANGIQRVFTVDDRATRDLTFGYEMAFVPSAAPVGDEDTLYVSMGNRLHALEIPDFNYLDKAKLAKEKRAKEIEEDPLYKEKVAAAPSLDSAQPDFYWGYLMADETTTFPPLIHGEQVSILTTAGNLISLPRFGRGGREERFVFKTIGGVVAAAGQHGATAYVGSDDFNLYAIDMQNGNLRWRHVSGAAIRQKPDVNDRDVFIVPEQTGLRRLDRRTGREVWTNREAARFLASTGDYVYALNPVGKFHVLDGRRGTILSTIDLTDWAIAVPNELTDRIYLAANDGQILCLRNRDHRKALLMKNAEVPKREEKKEEKKDEKKKDDDKKGAALRFGPSLATPRLLELRHRDFRLACPGYALKGAMQARGVQ